MELKVNTLLPNNRTISILSKTEESSNFYTRLKSSELVLPLYVRNRKPGDKVKDIYIDCKIEIDKRDNEPIVVDSKGTIVWLPGLKKSKFDKSKDEEYDIILWYN